MEKIIRYILIIIGTIILEWIFLALACTFFDAEPEGVIIGTAFFLTAEMIICTAAIISKIDKK